jgi:hypothetical protein
LKKILGKNVSGIAVFTVGVTSCSMLDFLRDPIWQFGGFAIGALGIIVGIWVSLRGRSKKITYEIISKTPLLNVDVTTVKRRLQVSFDGNPIDNAELVLLKIINIGSMPIRPDDYDQPLTITTGVSSRILDARITSTQPLSLVIPVTSIEDTAIILGQVLLNPQDSFIVQAVVAPKAEIGVDARIAGIKEIRRGAHKHYSQRVIAAGFLWIIGLAVIMFAWSGFQDFKWPFTLLAMGLAYFLGGVVLPRIMEWVRDAT